MTKTAGFRPTREGVAAIAVAVAVSLAGCQDTSFDPFQNDDRYYSVYGFIDLLEETHALRVIPISRQQPLIESPTSPQAHIDAKVFTTEDFSGETIEWRHSLERLTDGTYGHIFRADFFVASRATYTLRIERSDGAVTTAVTTIPEILEPPILERGPLRFSADSVMITQEIHAPRLPSPWSIQARYGFTGGFVDGQRVLVPYGRSGEQSAGGGWRLMLDVSKDRPLVQRAIEAEINDGQIGINDPVVLTSMGVQYRILDENWNPPGGIFDAELLSQPGAISNVEGGYGFFGSIGLYIEEWNTAAVSRLVGFD